MRYLTPALLFTVTAAFAADALPTVPGTPIGEKKELLFSDDFEHSEAKWQLNVVPAFTIENGVLKGTQTRFDAPAQGDKPAVKAHQAVAGIEVPTKDSIVELKFRFAGATAMSVEFDDRKFTGSHYGHICYCRLTPKSVNLVDQRDGNMNNEIMAMATDPAKKDERAKRLAGRSATFPVAIEPEQWHTLTVETIDDAMRASVDGKAVAYLKSSGIGHPTKSKVEFGTAGKDGLFDEIKIWNAAAVKP